MKFIIIILGCILFLSGNSCHHDSNEQGFETALRNHDLILVEQLAPQFDLDCFQMDHKPVLVWAIEQKKPQLVEILLKHKASPSDEALKTAFDSGQGNLVKILVLAGARLDQKNFNGQEPLAWALTQNQQGFLYNYALQHPHKAKINNQSFLRWAMNTGAIGLVEELVENGADIEEKDSQGNTLLCQAIQLGRTKLFDALLAKHAQLNALCEDRKTALHLAYELQRNSFVAKLNFHGADKNIRDSDGKVPEDYKDFWLTWDHSKQKITPPACKDLFDRANQASLIKAYRQIKKHIHPDHCAQINTAEDCREKNRVIDLCKNQLNI